jgi:hypothetical protein
MICRCERIDRLEGLEGTTYENEHLLEAYVDDVNWQILLECPDTGILWKLSKPASYMHGGGPSLYEKITPEQAHQEFARPIASQAR